MRFASACVDNDVSIAPRQALRRAHPAMVFFVAIVLIAAEVINSQTGRGPAAKVAGRLHEVQTGQPGQAAQRYTTWQAAN